MKAKLGMKATHPSRAPAGIGLRSAKEITPIRKIRNGGPRNTVIGKFPSQKMDKMVRFESGLERDFILWCEFDPFVMAYVEQPFQIKYTHQGRKRRYTPDFLLNWQDGRSCVVEIKPSHRLEVPKIALKLRLASNAIRELGYNFVVVTEKAIRREPHLSNICLLHRYARVTTGVSIYLACTNYLSQSEATFAEMYAALAPQGITKQHLYSLLFKGIIWTDLGARLTEESILRLPPPPKG